MARVILFLALAAILAVAAHAKIKKICTTGDCSKYKTGKFKKPLKCVKDVGKYPNPPDKPFCFSSSTHSDGCCNNCKNSTVFPCQYWLWVPNGGASICNSNPCGLCYLYPYHFEDPDDKDCDDGVPKSRLGRNCEHTKDDPHFLGAQGTHFDFNGEPDKSFCLYTDRNVHLNMKMTGYYDTHTDGASILKDGKALRTWIRQLAFIWRDAAAKKHTFVMSAREGKQQGRGAGFLNSAVLDGTTLPRMKPGQMLQLAGGLEFAFSGYTKYGKFDMDSYVVKIGNMLEVQADLRVAHPTLQRPTDAETHINVMFADVESTADVHGVMGQTFRNGRKERSIDYMALSNLLHRPVSADGATGQGFLDGHSSDYMSSSIAATDCKYSVFDGKVLPDTTYHPRA